MASRTTDEHDELMKKEVSNSYGCALSWLHSISETAIETSKDLQGKHDILGPEKMKKRIGEYNTDWNILEIAEKLDRVQRTIQCVFNSGELRKSDMM